MATIATEMEFNQSARKPAVTVVTHITAPPTVAETRWYMEVMAKLLK